MCTDNRPINRTCKLWQRRESGQVDHWELMVEDALGRLTEEERRQKKMNGPYRELSMNRGT